MDSLREKELNHHSEILHNCENGIWSEEQVKTYQEACIQRLLSHVKDTFRFMRIKKILSQKMACCK